MINNRESFASLVLRPHTVASYSRSRTTSRTKTTASSDRGPLAMPVAPPTANARVTFTDGKDAVRQLRTSGATGNFGYLEMIYRF